MTTPSPADYRLIGMVDKATDLKIAVRTVEVDGQRVIDVRDYVPSLDLYGRGVAVPVEISLGVAQLIERAGG